MKLTGLPCNIPRLVLWRLCLWIRELVALCYKTTTPLYRFTITLSALCYRNRVVTINKRNNKLQTVTTTPLKSFYSTVPNTMPLPGELKMVTPTRRNRRRAHAHTCVFMGVRQGAWNTEYQTDQPHLGNKYCFKIRRNLTS